MQDAILSAVADVTVRTAFRALDYGTRTALNALLERLERAPRKSTASIGEAIDQAQHVAALFLAALNQAEVATARAVCAPAWIDTKEGMRSVADLLQSAAPVSWAFRAHDPYEIEGGRAGIRLETAVTFDIGNDVFETWIFWFWVGQTPDGWRIESIEWRPSNAPAPPEPAPHDREPEHATLLSDWTFPIFDPASSTPSAATAAGFEFPCACGQILRVPQGKGRIRATCPSCGARSILRT